MPESTPESVQVSAPPPPRRRKRGGAKLLIVGLVLLGLLGVIVYLLSLINSKKFFLEAEGDQLLVKKGIFFPWGNEQYKPSDPQQAELYAPIDLPDELRHAGSIKFDDLATLNHEFGSHLIGLAASLVFSDDDAGYRKGKAYLMRVGRLQGLDAKQLQEIQGLSADMFYMEAKRAYLGVEQTLEDALRKFRKSQNFGTGRFTDTEAWIRKIRLLLDAIRMTKASPLGVPDLAPAPLPQPAPPEVKAPLEPAKDIQPLPKPKPAARPEPDEPPPATQSWKAPPQPTEDGI